VPIEAEAAASSQEGQEQSSEVPSESDFQEDKENQIAEQRPERLSEAQSESDSQEDKENRIAEQHQERLSEAQAAADSQEGKENQVMAVQERTECKKRPIALQDLFTKRRLKPDGPIEEISKVLLIGEAGTGKTTLSR
jgi:flagellar biosynthesis GTPase FlhF